MSEFQCYQFRSFDRPLTESERKEVNSWSSRAQVSSHSATFIYHYGDFRKSEEAAVEQYFDAMLYFANWGTRRLLMRLPASLIDAKAIQQFCLENEWSSDYISLQKKGKVYLLDINYDNEDGGYWMDEDDFDLGIIGQIRDDILRGDYRALYLIWVKFSQPNEDEEEDFEEEKTLNPPPVPANLKKLTGAMRAFIDFFEIDKDLVSAAQSLSSDGKSKAIDYDTLLLQLSEKERIEWLARLLKGEENQLGLSLKKRLEKMIPKGDQPKAPVFTPAQILAKSKKEEKKRQSLEAKAAKAEHIKKMKQFEKEEKRIWESITFNLARNSSKAYELATEALKDLRDLAEYQGKQDAFQKKVEALREANSRRFSLIGRWKKEGLI